jgi:hypothetical protein
VSERGGEEKGNRGERKRVCSRELQCSAAVDMKGGGIRTRGRGMAHRLPYVVLCVSGGCSARSALRAGVPAMNRWGGWKRQRGLRTLATKTAPAIVATSCPPASSLLVAKCCPSDDSLETYIVLLRRICGTMHGPHWCDVVASEVGIDDVA